MLLKLIDYVVSNFAVLFHAALIFLYTYIGAEFIHVAYVGFEKGQVCVRREVKLASRTHKIGIQSYLLLKVLKIVFQIGNLLIQLFFGLGGQQCNIFGIGLVHVLLGKRLSLGTAGQGHDANQQRQKADYFFHVSSHIIHLS